MLWSGRSPNRPVAVAGSPLVRESLREPLKAPRAAELEARLAVAADTLETQAGVPHDARRVGPADEPLVDGRRAARALHEVEWPTVWERLPARCEASFLGEPSSFCVHLEAVFPHVEV